MYWYLEGVHNFLQCGRIEVDGNDCDVTVEKLLQGNSRITLTGEGVCIHWRISQQPCYLGVILITISM